MKKFTRAVAGLTIALGIFFMSSKRIDASALTFSNVRALQNNGSTSIDLFSNPQTTLLGPQLTFAVDIAGTLSANTSDILSLTFSESGRAPVTQTFSIPLFGSINPPFTLLFSFQSLNFSYTGAQAFLTIDIIGSNPDFVIPSGPNRDQMVDSYTYSFQVAEPVPEPATFVMLGLGLCGIAAKLRNSRKN